MAQEELIDTLVSNEQLGIGKKTSVFKLIFICLVFLVVGFLAYTFFMDTKPEQEQPALVLGGSVVPPGSQTIQPAEAVVPSPQLTAPVIHPDSAQAQPIQAVLNTASLPIVAGGLTPTSVMPVATQQTQQVAIQPVQQLTALANSAPNAPTQTVGTQAIQSTQSPQAALKLVATESVISAIEPPPIKRKPVAFKKPAAKVKVNNSTIAEETHAPAIPMEEGVTREEIIVIQ